MITPLDNTIKGVMNLTWPMIVISVLIISSIRLFDIFKNRKEFCFYKEVMGLIFMIYVLCLFQVVTFEDPISVTTSNNFVPFQEIMRYKIGSRLFLKNVIGNLVMFVPYGIFVSYYVKADNKWNTLFLVTFASLTIEATQMAIGRVFDVDDIILNVAGGFVGYLIYYILGRIGSRLPKFMRKSGFLNLLTAICLGFLLYYVWMVAK